MSGQRERQSTAGRYSHAPSRNPTYQLISTLAIGSNRSPAQIGVQLKSESGSKRFPAWVRSPLAGIPGSPGMRSQIHRYGNAPAHSGGHDLAPHPEADHASGNNGDLFQKSTVALRWRRSAPGRICRPPLDARRERLANAVRPARRTFSPSYRTPARNGPAHADRSLIPCGHRMERDNRRLLWAG